MEKGISADTDMSTFHIGQYRYKEKQNSIMFTLNCPIILCMATYVWITCFIPRFNQIYTLFYADLCLVFICKDTIDVLQTQGRVYFMIMFAVAPFTVLFVKHYHL